jgi:hypothetical protein
MKEVRKPAYFEATAFRLFLSTRGVRLRRPVALAMPDNLKIPENPRRRILGSCRPSPVAAFNPGLSTQ